MIPRLIEKLVLERLKDSNKIVIVLGARQVGKTTLLESLKLKFKESGKTVLYLNCDTEEDLLLLNTSSLIKINKLVSNIDYLLIDEAQRLENPGLTLKIIHDNFEKIKIIATGSSSFELKNRLSDALTGRYLDFTLHPLSLEETPESFLEELLVFGSYPEIYLAKKKEERILYLRKILESYLFRDILSFQKVRNAQAIKDLTQAISYQISSEVNENELASRLKIDRKTVVSYLDILEQSFVIKRLFPYSRNPRREIGKKFKIYFIDLGIRNALIGDFNPTNLRQDFGALWENYLIIERMKFHVNRGEIADYNFWRSYSGAEVDLLERKLPEGKVLGYEIKLGQKGASKGAKLFSVQYKIPLKVINKENYLEFIVDKQKTL